MALDALTTAFTLQRVDGTDEAQNQLHEGVKPFDRDRRMVAVVG